jgi:hypothetical protein
MAPMTTAPVDHPLDLLTQDILTYGSWGLTLVLLGVAVHLGRKERTPFYVLVVLASMVAAFAEPLYDTAMQLYFYSGDKMYTHFTAFDVPQPIWTHSGYAVLYAAPALAIAYKIRQRTLTANGLLAWAGVELTMSCVFEMVGINGGAYTYWGAHEFRIFDYPLVIGVLEAAQVICFAVGASILRERSSCHLSLLGLFVLFPFTFFGANFGAGSAVIIALHLEDPSRLLVGLASLLSMGFAVVLIRAAGSLLPVANGVPTRSVVNPVDAVPQQA